MMFLQNKDYNSCRDDKFSIQRNMKICNKLFFFKNNVRRSKLEREGNVKFRAYFSMLLFMRSFLYYLFRKKICYSYALTFS